MIRGVIAPLAVARQLLADAHEQQERLIARRKELPAVLLRGAPRPGTRGASAVNGPGYLKLSTYSASTSASSLLTGTRADGEGILIAPQ